VNFQNVSDRFRAQSSPSLVAFNLDLVDLSVPADTYPPAAHQYQLVISPACCPPCNQSIDLVHFTLQDHAWFILAEVNADEWVWLLCTLIFT
jgi:hypothetical protein